MQLAEPRGSVCRNRGGEGGGSISVKPVGQHGVKWVGHDGVKCLGQFRLKQVGQHGVKWGGSV